MRALMPQVEVKSNVNCMHLLDDEKKTVLRIYIEQSECRDPNEGDYIACGGLLRLQPVRGYPEPLTKVKKLISKKSDLTVADEGLFEQALNAIGKEPCGYSSKLSFQFDSTMPAVLAAKQIHLHLLNIVEANIPGVKQDLDSEFLHDLRVAVRRIRSALTQIKGVFSTEDLNKFKSRLAWVGQVTGPTRDMDVFLLEFEQYRDCLPERFRNDLDPLHDFLENHQEMEHRVMVRKINSPYFRTLVKELRSFLEDTTEHNGAPEAAIPISDLADKRIYKMYCRVIKDGKNVNDDSPAEHLHDLRKECKKLRYLMEFFRSIYPDKKIAQLIKSLKQLLDNLGNFQDLEVQADKLRDYARQMVEESETPHDTLLAMGMLVDALLTKQQQARVEFADRFASFSKQENQKIFKELFAPKKNKGKG
jgi:CHAD domain-containing protein